MITHSLRWDDKEAEEDLWEETHGEAHRKAERRAAPPVRCWIWKAGCYQPYYCHTDQIPFSLILPPSLILSIPEIAGIDFFVGFLSLSVRNVRNDHRSDDPSL